MMAAQLDDNRPVIMKVDNIGKKYRIKNLKTLPADAGKLKKLGYHLKKYQKNDFWALKNISFEIRQGDRLAIVGRNGAGKSTLLKLISRITEPTEGRIEYYGRVAAMLEVGTGFNPELTGRENVYLNGAILGMTKDMIDERFDGIVEFSEIGDFIDTPVKRYSSGMMVRLAFAVASTMDPDILIIDEVLSVGDMKFREKCLQRMNEIASSGKTILCVSHVMNIIRGLCNRAIVLEHGRMIYEGEIEQAIKLYNGIHEEARITSRDLENLPRPRFLNEKMRMLHVDVLENRNCIYNWDEPIRFLLRVETKLDAECVSLRVVFRCDNGTPAATAFLPLRADFKAGEIKDIYVSVDRHNLAPGDYKVGLELTQESPYDDYHKVDKVVPEAFFVTVRNIGAQEHVLEDDSSRLWIGSWGNSRIMDVTGEVRG
ncbi:MAG: ABC transporter ATP-binding protein [Clostridia bacterium]|nr:ABC transporter ATP-binding protein [Clostridia bacterium]